jgi:protein-S-isoprenylcysteine O-methyltransferase Ste14
MVIRARQEDRMLRAELGGYEAYAHRVAPPTSPLD